MAKGLLLAFSDPISADREGDYNAWYNGIHANEVTSLSGFGGMTRYRAVAQMSPPSESHAYRYLAVYELHDIEAGMSALQAATPNLNMSDAMDLNNALVVAFEPIFSSSEKT
ncbi:MAG TPA: hypothetical protein VGL34_21585 [Steroidobacteraceae bacterium]|jgi:hypothetical protein